MNDQTPTVLVLGGGPGRERQVSLLSRAAVAAALTDAGHRVLERDITPDDTSALNEAADVIFPALHGRWGEGGPLQQLLEARGIAYVGCGPEAAALAMDKFATKRAAELAGVPTPPARLLDRQDPAQNTFRDLFADDGAGAVIKPIDEGSSVDVRICRSLDEADQAARELTDRYDRVMAERFVVGREMTVAIVGEKALPILEIVPATAFYDYQAKYERDDTSYRFDVDLDAEAQQKLAADALTLHRALGCRHLSRVDFVVDGAGMGWMLEINTMPGFTSHSLLPMAAKHAGMAMPALCDRLVRLAMQMRAGR